MVIVDRGRISLSRSLKFKAAGQLIATGLLLCFAFSQPVVGQLQVLNRAQRELDNGNYADAINHARMFMDKANDTNLTLGALDLILISQITWEKRDEAAVTLERFLELLASNKSDPRQNAQIYLRAAELFRSQRKYADALKHAKKAQETAPNNPNIRADYYLMLGKIMFSSGYDLSAIIWLEKAEKLFELKPVSPGRLETYRFLSLSWTSKANYPAALKYSEKFITTAAVSRFRHKYRQSLFEGATLLSSIGQHRKAFKLREKGLRLSLDQNNTYQARNFLASLLLNCLYDGNVAKASNYLEQLNALDRDNRFAFETTLGNATISALTGRREMSEKLFTELGKQKNTSPFILPTWKVTIAEKSKDWEQVIRHNHDLLELTVAENFRVDLPGIYLSFATAFFHLNQGEKSLEYLDKTLSLVEEIRNSEDRNLSLGLLEIYHKAYRLLTQLKLDRPSEAFELSDYLKARLLKDKINNSTGRVKSAIAPDLRRKLEILSLEMIENSGVASEIKEIETSFTTHIPETVIPKPDFSGLDKVPELENKAVISYLFTLDERLLAFVWEKGKPIRSAYLPASETDLAADVKRTEQKIKNRIFFKRDGKDLFDKLLKPLNISATHLVIVPDKQLWKIPFQALSPDGEKYLIEDKLVSYAPSVSILVEQLKSPKPARHTLQAYANSSYNNQFLRYVNDESTSVSALFNSRPALNATILDFRRLSDKSDMLHFSMHAQVDNDQPLDSFLGFRAVGKDNGRLTVENILDSKLKKGSLVFLASCDSNNVLSGEGLVSLAWGMMGAGATTVISAQWEANDKLTGVFSKAFYKYLKQGSSPAEALQRASVEMIRNKSKDLHEPYYWADFTLNGDFR